MSREECQKVYRQESVNIIDEQICAGGKKGYDSWWVSDLFKII